MKAVHLFGRALRETGQALDRFGLTIAGNEIFNESFSRHRPVMSLVEKNPEVSSAAFVAPTAAVIGNVSLSEKSSIWYGAVVRGDRAKVTIGTASNIQDRSVINTASQDVEIGNFVTVGHGALITSSKIGNNVLVGQGAVIQEGSVIEENSIIGAGAVLLPGTQVPSSQLWAGNPAKFVRNCTAEEIKFFDKSASGYSEIASKHASEF